MQTHLRKLWDSLRSNYWFVPAAMMALAALLWRGVLFLDHWLYASNFGTIRWLYSDDTDALRTLLLTIAGTVVGIVGVVFSILMVPLTIAATQFGPRLLRTFLRDLGTQMTLGTFTATLTFCILVVLQLRNQPIAYFPQVAATIGLLLGLLSFGVLLYFINHVAVSIQAPVVVAQVSKELHQVIDRDFPHLLEEGNYSTVTPEAIEIILIPYRSKKPLVVLAKASGYVQLWDDKKLVSLAQEQNSMIELLYKSGDFMVQHTPLAFVWSATETYATMEATINAAFILGTNRTLIQDVAFGINELVEVAIRALSPAINDPFTAMTCLDWLSTALCKLCSRSFPPPTYLDSDNQVRLISSPVTFTLLADAAFNQIREYGRTSRAVSLRLMDTITVVTKCAKTEEQRAALLKHATLVEQACHIGLSELEDRQLITAKYNALKQWLSKIESRQETAETV